MTMSFEMTVLFFVLMLLASRVRRGPKNGVEPAEYRLQSSLLKDANLVR